VRRLLFHPLAPAALSCRKFLNEFKQLHEDFSSVTASCRESPASTVLVEFCASTGAVMQRVWLD
jgi:hypothetical protein